MGPEFVERLNGMFALAIWDRRSRTLLLTRDRYGIKPLYMTSVGSILLFASEIKSFLQHPDFRPELSPEHLLEYFTFQNLFTDGTLFRGVSLLPPGQSDRRVEGEAPERRTYWDFDFTEEGGHTSDEEYIEELDRLFRRRSNGSSSATWRLVRLSVAVWTPAASPLSLPALPHLSRSQAAST